MFGFGFTLMLLPIRNEWQFLTFLLGAAVTTVSFSETYSPLTMSIVVWRLSCPRRLETTICQPKRFVSCCRFWWWSGRLGQRSAFKMQQWVGVFTMGSISQFELAQILNGLIDRCRKSRYNGNCEMYGRIIRIVGWRKALKSSEVWWFRQGWCWMEEPASGCSS